MQKRPSCGDSDSSSGNQAEFPDEEPFLLEAKFSQVEHELSRHAHYIESNGHRIPEFQSAAEAESELRSLLETLKQVQAPRSRSRGREKANRRDVSTRLGIVSKQRQELFEEETRIQKLRAVAEAAQQREDSEYSSLRGEIDDARTQLEALHAEIATLRHVSTKTKQTIRQMSDELSSRTAMLDQPRTEKHGLKELEKQSRREIRRLEEDQASGKLEEDRVLAIEQELDGRQIGLKKLQKILSEQILRDADRLEYRLDEAVGHASEVTEQQINLMSDEESSDGSRPEEEQRRPRTVIPSFLRFRRTLPEASEEEKEKPHTPVRVRDVRQQPSASRGSSATHGSAVSGQRSFSGEAESSGDTPRPVPVRDKDTVKPGLSRDLRGEAMQALQMPVADTARLGARIEAVTGKERTLSFFD
jgi:hypothetical protein